MYGAGFGKKVPGLKFQVPYSWPHDLRQVPKPPRLWLLLLSAKGTNKNPSCGLVVKYELSNAWKAPRRFSELAVIIIGYYTL